MILACSIKFERAIIVFNQIQQKSNDASKENNCFKNEAMVKN
jgi:hypothetical protein